jgi:hypothetical protein
VESVVYALASKQTVKDVGISLQDPTVVKVIERELTEDERFSLAFAARRMALQFAQSGCPRSNKLFQPFISERDNQSSRISNFIAIEYSCNNRGTLLYLSVSHRDWNLEKWLSNEHKVHLFVILWTVLK